MKLIIAGGRYFNNKDLLFFHASKILATEIVSGGARGADYLGEQYANVNNIPIKKFPAKWNLYGKSAGYIRNKQMAEYGDMLLAFWDGKSKGTQHMIRLATENKLQVIIINY